MVRKGGSSRVSSKRPTTATTVVGSTLPPSGQPALTYGGNGGSAVGGTSHHHNHHLGNGLISGPGKNSLVVLSTSTASVAVDEDCCPQCGVQYNTSNYRKVTESCGHAKCRSCIILSEEGCTQCSGGSSRSEKESLGQYHNHHHQNSRKGPTIVDVTGSSGSHHLTRRAAAAHRLQSATNSRTNSVNSARPTSSSPSSSASNDTGRQSSSVYSDSADSDSCLRFSSSISGGAENDTYPATIDFEAMAELTSPNIDPNFLSISDYNSTDNKSYTTIINEDSEFSKSLMSLRKLQDPSIHNNNNSSSSSGTTSTTLGTTGQGGLVTRAQLKEMPTLAPVSTDKTATTSSPPPSNSRSSAGSSTSRRRTRDSSHAESIADLVNSKIASGGGSPDITQGVPRDSSKVYPSPSPRLSSPTAKANSSAEKSVSSTGTTSRLSALLTRSSSRNNKAHASDIPPDPLGESSQETPSRAFAEVSSGAHSSSATDSHPSTSSSAKKVDSTSHQVVKEEEDSNPADNGSDDDSKGGDEDDDDDTRMDEGDGGGDDPVPKKKKKRSPVVIHDHITVLGGEPPMYQCNVCQKKFKTKAHIKYHEFCQKGDKPFKCEQCGQGFIAKSHYEYHLRTHTGERPYVCPKCGKGFNQRGKVTRHMRSHTGEKPFVCQECNRGFANAQALRSHTLIHTGERPFACTYCNKRFTGMTNLKKHVITHTGERPFTCNHCGKSFGLKWTLDLHLRTHSSERPYACDQCSRAFSNSKDLRRHLVIHSGERPFKCWICGTAFRRKDNLDRHIKNTHNQPKEVAKKLANEAAAEYLKQTTKNQSLGNIPVSKVNSVVISNIIKNADLMPAGGIVPNNLHNRKQPGVSSTQTTPFGKVITPKVEPKASTSTSGSGATGSTPSSSSTATTTPSSVQQSSPTSRRRVIITAPLSPPTTRASRSKETDSSKLEQRNSALPNSTKKSRSLRQSNARSKAASPQSAPNTRQKKAVPAPPPPETEEEPANVPPVETREKKRKSKKKKAKRSKSKKQDRSERVPPPPSPPITVEPEPSCSSRRNGESSSNVVVAETEEPEERETVVSAAEKDKRTPPFGFCDDLDNRRPTLTLVTPQSPVKEEEKSPGQEVDKSPKHEQSDDFSSITTLISSSSRLVLESSDTEQPSSFLSQAEAEVEEDHERVECILPHGINEVDEADLMDSLANAGGTPSRENEHEDMLDIFSDQTHTELESEVEKFQDLLPRSAEPQSELHESRTDNSQFDSIQFDMTCVQSPASSPSEVKALVSNDELSGITTDTVEPSLTPPSKDVVEDEREEGELVDVSEDEAIFDDDGITSGADAEAPAVTSLVDKQNEEESIVPDVPKDYDTTLPTSMERDQSCPEQDADAKTQDERVPEDVPTTALPDMTEKAEQEEEGELVETPDVSEDEATLDDDDITSGVDVEAPALTSLPDKQNEEESSISDVPNVASLPTSMEIDQSCSEQDADTKTQDERVPEDVQTDALPDMVENVEQKEEGELVETTGDSMVKLDEKEADAGDGPVLDKSAEIKSDILPLEEEAEDALTEVNKENVMLENLQKNQEPVVHSLEQEKEVQERNIECSKEEEDDDDDSHLNSTQFDMTCVQSPASSPSEVKALVSNDEQSGITTDTVEPSLTPPSKDVVEDEHEEGELVDVSEDEAIFDDDGITSGADAEAHAVTSPPDKQNEEESSMPDVPNDTTLLTSMEIDQSCPEQDADAKTQDQLGVPEDVQPTALPDMVEKVEQEEEGELVETPESSMVNPDEKEDVAGDDSVLDKSPEINSDILPLEEEAEDVLQEVVKENVMLDDLPKSQEPLLDSVEEEVVEKEVFSVQERNIECSKDTYYEEDEDDDDDRLYVDESYDSPTEECDSRAPSSADNMDVTKTDSKVNITACSIDEPVSKPEEPAEVEEETSEMTVLSQCSGMESSLPQQESPPPSPKLHSPEPTATLECPQEPCPEETEKPETSLPPEISDFVLSVLDNKSDESLSKMDDLESISSESLASPHSDVENSIKKCIQTLESDCEEEPNSQEPNREESEPSPPLKSSTEPVVNSPSPSIQVLSMSVPKMPRLSSNVSSHSQHSFSLSTRTSNLLPSQEQSAKDRNQSTVSPVTTPSVASSIKSNFNPISSAVCSPSTHVFSISIPKVPIVATQVPSSPQVPVPSTTATTTTPAVSRTSPVQTVAKLSGVPSPTLSSVHEDASVPAPPPTAPSLLETRTSSPLPTTLSPVLSTAEPSTIVAPVVAAEPSSCQLPVSPITATPTVASTSPVHTVEKLSVAPVSPPVPVIPTKPTLEAKSPILLPPAIASMLPESVPPVLEVKTTPLLPTTSSPVLSGAAVPVLQTTSPSLLERTTTSVYTTTASSILPSSYKDAGVPTAEVPVVAAQVISIPQVPVTSTSVKASRTSPVQSVEKLSVDLPSSLSTNEVVSVPLLPLSNDAESPTSVVTVVTTTSSTTLSASMPPQPSTTNVQNSRPAFEVSTLVPKEPVQIQLSKTDVVTTVSANSCTPKSAGPTLVLASSLSGVTPAAPTTTSAVEESVLLPAPTSQPKLAGPTLGVASSRKDRSSRKRKGSSLVEKSASPAPLLSTCMQISHLSTTESSTTHLTSAYDAAPPPEPVPTRVQFMLPQSVPPVSTVAEPSTALAVATTSQPTTTPVAYDPSLLYFVQPDGQHAFDGNYQLVYAAAAATAERDEGVMDGPPKKVRLLYAEALGVGSDSKNGNELQFYYAATAPNQHVEHASTPCHVQLMEPCRVTYSETTNGATSEMLQYQVQPPEQQQQQHNSQSNVLNLSVNQGPMYYYNYSSSTLSQQSLPPPPPPLPPQSGQQESPLPHSGYSEHGLYTNTSTTKVVIAHQNSYPAMEPSQQITQHHSYSHYNDGSGEVQDLSARRLELPVHTARNDQIAYAQVRPPNSVQYNFLEKAREVQHVFPQGALRHCDSNVVSYGGHSSTMSKQNLPNGMLPPGYSKNGEMTVLNGGNSTSETVVDTGGTKMTGLELLSAATERINYMQYEACSTERAAMAIAVVGEMARMKRMERLEQNQHRHQQRTPQQAPPPRPEVPHSSIPIYNNYLIPHQSTKVEVVTPTTLDPFPPQLQDSVQRQQTAQLYQQQNVQFLQAHPQYPSTTNLPPHANPSTHDMMPMGADPQNQQAGIRRGPRKYYLSRSAQYQD